MNNYKLFTILIAIAVISVLSYFYFKKTPAELFEFTDDPDDSETPLTSHERENLMTIYQLEQNADMQNVVDNNIDFNMNPQAYSYAYEAGAIRTSPDQYVDNIDPREINEAFRVYRGGGGGGSWGGGGGGGSWGGGGGWGHHGGGGWGGFSRPWRPYHWRRLPYFYYPYSYYNYYDYVYPSSPSLRYSVRIMPKQGTHPYSARGYSKGYSIIGATGGTCGISGAELTLKRGVTYEFDIFTSKDCLTGEPEHEPFFFTTDPAGGRDTGRVFNVKPTVNGVLRVTPDANTPSMFFYNSSNHKFVGGIVRII